MKWLVCTQPHTPDPVEVVEVRTFVVVAETENGVRAKIAEHQTGQMIRGMVQLQGGEK